MKGNFSFFITPLFCVVSTCAFAQGDDFNLKNAGDYNNFIMKEMTATVQKNFEYISFSVHSDEYEQLERKRGEVILEINKAKDNIRQMPPLDGDTRLRDEAVEVLDEYRSAFEKDYKTVNGLKRKSRDSYETMAAYFEAEDKAEAKVNKATQQLRKSQRVYASKYNMEMAGSSPDSVLELKMNKIVAVNNYWRIIYLDYFKVSNQYDKMWEVLSEKKPAIIDRERLKVLEVINTILPHLKTLPAFKGDVEVRDQTINMIEYFQSVSQNSFKRVVDILYKKNMEQKDLDEINSMINQCNEDHQRLIYNWNIASRDLFKKSVDTQ